MYVLPHETIAVVPVCHIGLVRLSGELAPLPRSFPVSATKTGQRCYIDPESHDYPVHSSIYDSDRGFLLEASDPSLYKVIPPLTL